MDIVTQERMDAKVPFSSSSLNTLLTTTKGNNEDLTQIVENSPEMGYWHIEPNIITNKQFQIWLTEFNLTPDILITYLDRCRFDMVELGKETDLKKGSAANWFYGVMKKRGGSYPEPSGYKSIKELKLEEEKKILEKNERITKEAYELKLRQDFSTIFKDPTSKEYQACLEIMCTDKNLFVPDKNGVAFQEIMWLTYKALREEGKIHDS
jgi:hypothetical protein